MRIAAALCALIMSLLMPLALSAAPSKNGMTLLYHFPPDDDEDSGSYDPATGLGAIVACAKHGKVSTVTMQFSRSRKGNLTFAAAFVPDKGPRTRPTPEITHTLTSTSPLWMTTKTVTGCDDAYVLYVAYPTKK